jgi:RNA polymerase sigma-B factor
VTRASTIRFPTAAEREHIERVCVVHSSTRDPKLRVEIVESHQWLALLCARQLRRRGEALDDLMQVANVGLLQAVDRFDPTYGVTFRTFASATMTGVLRRHYRTVWRLRVPRRIQELHVTVGRSIEVLTGELQRSPTVPEVATRLGVSQDDVLEAIDAGANLLPRSLDYSEEQTAVAVTDDALEAAERRIDVKELLDTVQPFARRVLYLRFFQGMTQTEIAEELGTSQVQISRILRSTLANLRSTMGAHDPALD